MQLLKTGFLTLFLLVSVVSISSAQKYGHLNLGNLLSELPEVKAAESELEAYQKQLATKGQSMVKAYETAMLDAQKKLPEWSPNQVEEEKLKLQKQEMQIMKYEQDMTVQVQEKRQTLLGPILQKVETSIKEVAEAEGYLMIFDTSIFNAILFAKDSEDVTERVKSKL